MIFSAALHLTISLVKCVDRDEVMVDEYSDEKRVRNLKRYAEKRKGAAWSRLPVLEAPGR
jgi:hypothetical protein